MVTQYSAERSGDGSLKLVAEKVYDYPEHIAEPEDVVGLVNACLRLNLRLEEHIILLCFTAKMEPHSVFEVAVGTATGCLFSAREFLIRALLCGAVCIAVVHNHTSGDPTPSAEDDLAYKNLSNAAELIGLCMVDFVIAGTHGLYYSYAEHAGN